jgi:hypothetical protein
MAYDGAKRTTADTEPVAIIATTAIKEDGGDYNRTRPFL